jgi:hypothetical protein
MGRAGRPDRRTQIFQTRHKKKTNKSRNITERAGKQKKTKTTKTTTTKSNKK